MEAPSFEVDVVEHSGDWACLSYQDILHSLVTATITAAALKDPDRVAFSRAELVLIFSDDDYVQQLNRQYRNKDKPTNVLSFPNPRRNNTQGEPVHLGDVVFALTTLMQEAESAGKSPRDHFAHLVVHGVLHLLGYDHITEEDADSMEKLEFDVLQKFGISNPYEM